MIKLENLSAGYDDHTVLDDITFEVPTKGCCGILGESGCGKSTLLRILAGFIPPTSGQVILGSEIVTNNDPSQRGVVYHPQERSVLSGLNAWSNIAMALPENITGTSSRKEVVRKAANQAKIEHLLYTRRAFSGGEATRIAMARVIASQAPFVFLDEPFSSLDASHRYSLRVEMKTILTGIGATTMLVTHDIRDLEGMGVDWIGVIGSGKLIQFGTLADVCENPATQYVADLLKF